MILETTRSTSNPEGMALVCEIMSPLRGFLLIAPGFYNRFTPSEFLQQFSDLTYGSFNAIFFV